MRPEVSWVRQSGSRSKDLVNKPKAAGVSGRTSRSGLLITVPLLECGGGHRVSVRPLRELCSPEVDKFQGWLGEQEKKDFRQA